MPDPEPALVTPQDASASVVANGAKLVGESLLPGAGLAHTAAGFGARAVLGSFGPIGVLVVAANSYTKSVTKRNLYEHLLGAVKTTRLQPPIATSPAPAAKS
jgi:hypothetical protein